MRTILKTLVLFQLVISTGCEYTQPVPDEPSYLGQGTMVGEVTDQSAILQTRLTRTDTLYKNDVPGLAGMVRFVLGVEETLGEGTMETPWMSVDSTNDFIAKIKVDRLEPNQRYYYKAWYGTDTVHIRAGETGTFRTHPGPGRQDAVSFAVVTGMNYYHFHFGNYNPEAQYTGPDKHLGYPALEAVAQLAPDYFIGTGDNVYFDHPAEIDMKRAMERGRDPLPGLFGGKAVVDEAGMRQKYHVQFVQPRFRDLFRQVGTYWEKDDHDYRVNDSDPYMDFPISHEMGIRNFREQLPVVDPAGTNEVTYRTYRMSDNLQIWLVEGRDHRSANDAPNGPDKTLWGIAQLEWLKETLYESTAKYKILISPTPLVGPDDAYKRDNHVNPRGFRREGDAFFKWLGDNGFLQKNFYIICGDRHWQYHAVHPSGFEEFSCGALVDANSRAGRLAGDPKSTDPKGEIEQLYIQGTPEQASGGFLLVRVDSMAVFSFYDEQRQLLYEVQK